MIDQTKTLDELIHVLPTEDQKQVRDFVEFLLEKRAKKPRGKMRMEWAGALKDLKDTYTSVELQHKASDWMAGEK